MKKIIIILVFISLLFFGGLIFAARNVDKIIASAKPTIESSIAAAVGGKISIGDIKTTVFPETAVQINSIQISDSPTIPTVSVDSIALKVSFASLLKGNLNVHELTIRKPNITFANTATPSAPTQTKNTPHQQASTSSKPEEALANLPITFNLQRFSIEGGSVLLADNTTGISKLEVNSGAKFENGIASLERLKVTANFASQPITIEAAHGSFNLHSGQVQTKGAIIDIAGLRTNVDLDFNKQTQVGDMTLNVSSNSLNGVFETLKALKPDFTPPPFQLTGISMPITLHTEGSNFTAQSPQAKLTVNGAALVSEFDVTGSSSKITAKKFVANAFGGSFESPFELNILDSGVSAPITIKNIGIEPSLKALAPQLPVKMFGVINNFSGNFGTSYKTNVMAAASGTGKFAISSGGIREINILGKIIDALAGIPILGDALKLKLAPSVLAVARSEDTTFQSLSGNLNITKGVASISSIAFDSELFRANGGGTFNLVDKSMAFNITAYLKPELVQNLILAGKDFEKVANPDGTITVPLIIKGGAGGMQVLPDVNALAKSAAGKVLKEQAGKALQKVFGEKNSEVAKGVGKLLGF